MRIAALYDSITGEPDPDTAIQEYTRLMQMSLDAKFNRHMKEILLKIGERYANKGDYTNALKYMQQALPYNYLPIDRASNYSHIGWVYVSMGDYVTASEYFYKALESLKQVNDADARKLGEYTLIYRFLGMINNKLHQDEKALYFLNLGEDMARKNKRPNFIAVMLNSKGDFYDDTNQPDSARKYYAEAVEIARQAGLTAIEAEANAGIGKSLVASRQYKEALLYLQLATKDDEHMDKNAMIDARYYLGEALYHLGQYKEAEHILVTTLKQAIARNSYDNITKGYTALIDVYKATRQYRAAVASMEAMNMIKDSLMGAEKARDINLLDIRFHTAEKDRQIAVQQGKIARKDTWILGIGSAIILLLVISVAVYLHALQKQRTSAAYLKTLEKENKIEILKAVVQGGDHERSHIAAELHDGIGGMLSAAVIRFSALGNENAAIPAMDSYREAMKILTEAGDEIRKTAHNLMPGVLLKQDLPDAVQAYCNNVQANGALQVDFHCMGVFDGLTQQYKLNLYRIIQELVKNVVQHAGATQALVQLLLNEHMLIVSVEDNGVGFDMSREKNGIGLYNTQTRVSSLDGTFVLDSAPGKGTSVFIEFKNPQIG